jgi:hypothetical protein
MVPEVGIAPTSPRLQRSANLPQLLGGMVVPAGNAPASSGYQPGALLLSYRTMAEGVGNAPTSAMPTLFSRQVQPACICLPSVNWSGWGELHSRPPPSEGGRLLLTLHPEFGSQSWTRTNTVRFNKPSCYFDTTWQFEIGAAGRTSTCIVPFRRRMPHVFGHGSIRKWSERQVFHLRPPGPKPGRSQD